MVITLQSKSGKILKEKYSGDISLGEAKEKFKSPFFEVIKVEKEIYGNWSNEKANRIIANEGIDYAVNSYCGASEFEDPKTRELWTKAGNALDSLRNYLGYNEWEEENDY